jgi:inner membrane protein
MDNVTHTLFALTLARTPLGRARGAAAALVLASNAPDLDAVAAFAGNSSYLTWHRGPTHGPLGVVGLGLLAAGLVWAAQRVFPGRGSTTFRTLVPAALAGVLAHILMDLPTSYGTRLLSPFSWQWFALDLLPIIDVYLMVALAGCLFLGRGSRARGQKAAAVALVLMATNYGVRVIAHQRALGTAAREFGAGLPPPCDPQQAFRSLVDSWPGTAGAAGESDCLVETAALPTFSSPFRWRVIAQLPDAYEFYDIDLVDQARQSDRVPNEWTTVVAEAAMTPAARALLAFSRFPYARAVAEPSGQTVVQFTDVRFANGPPNAQFQQRRSALFTVTVRFAADGRVIGERLRE